MKTLNLTLTKGWFDMILSGEKTEEYREIKMYWAQRLMNGFPKVHGIEKLNPDFKHFDTITFKNGYSKNARTMIIEHKGIEMGVGLYIFGAPNYPVFIIKLGKIIETKNT